MVFQCDEYINVIQPRAVSHYNALYYYLNLLFLPVCSSLTDNNNKSLFHGLGEINIMKNIRNIAQVYRGSNAKQIKVLNFFFTILIEQSRTKKQKKKRN